MEYAARIRIQSSHGVSRRDVSKSTDLVFPVKSSGIYLCNVEIGRNGIKVVSFDVTQKSSKDMPLMSMFICCFCSSSNFASCKIVLQFVELSTTVCLRSADRNFFGSVTDRQHRQNAFHLSVTITRKNYHLRIVIDALFQLCLQRINRHN